MGDQEIIEAVALAICDESLVKMAAYPCAVRQAKAALAIAEPLIAQREREKALEEAAKVVEDYKPKGWDAGYQPAIAAAIRAMKDTTNED